MIQFEKVSKKFGSIIALSDISFNIDDGEFVFITGPSGSGKTTIIRLILSEILPDGGKIIFDKKNISELKNREIPTHRQQIGVVFQDFKLIPEKTVWENIAVSLAIRNLPEREWSDRIHQVLKVVNLEKRQELFPAQLSGGEMQRVALARSLAGNPKLILADEPTGNLDLKTSFEVMELFDKINKEGKTIIMATHNSPIVDKLKRRVIQLEDSKLVRDQQSAKYHQ